MWKTINDIAKYKKKFNNQITNLINKKGEKVTDSKEMANIFNKYFSEVGQKMATDIKEPINVKKSTFLSLITQMSNSFYLKPVTTTDIIRYLRQLNPAKSSGVDGIPIKYLLINAQIIAPTLTCLFNNCI